jgi:hypothetical protein
MLMRLRVTKQQDTGQGGAGLSLDVSTRGTIQAEETFEARVRHPQCSPSPH